MEPDGDVVIEREYIQPRKPFRKSRGSFFVRLFIVMIVSGAILAAIAISVLRTDYFQFRQVKVFGVETFSPKEIEDYTRNYMSGMYLKAIPRSNTILFSKTKFESQLKKDFSIIDIAYVAFPDPHTVAIHIKERVPVAVWCFTDQSCEFIDEHGSIYAHAPKFSEGVYPIFQSQAASSETNTLGTQIINPDIMNRFVELFNRLQSDDIRLSKVYLYEDGDIAFSIERLFGAYPRNDATLKGTFSQDDDVFVRDILTGLNNNAFKKQFLSNPKDLDYIDMRFAGKIFYKFKSKEAPLEKNSEVQ